MRLPPIDENKNVIPHDHEEMLNTEHVIRRIPLLHVVEDTGTGLKKISSAAYNSSTTGSRSMSVDIEKLIISAGQDAKLFVTNPHYIGSVKIEIGKLRGLNCLVGYEPLPDNDFHGGVWGDFNKKLKRDIQAAAEWFVPIDGVSTA